MGKPNGRDVLAGGAAGLLATAPMTLFMALARRALPRRERHPLPPRAVTVNVARALGVPLDAQPNPQQAAVALAAHFAFGAVAGAGYGAVAGATKLPPAVEGMGYGLALWVGTYLGVLPASGLFSPAIRHAPRRTALMIGAHLVYGAALGVGVHALRQSRDPEA